MMYIYCITCIINNKVYIGQHKWIGDGLDPNYLCSSKNPEFWEDYYNYGSENFKKDLIQKCYSDDALDIMERIWIKYYRRILGWDKVYNISGGGNSGWSSVNRWLKDYPDIAFEMASRRARTAIKNGTSSLLNLTHEQIDKRNKNIAKALKLAWEKLTPEEKSERAKRSIKTQAETHVGLFGLTEEQISARASKGAKTQWAKGNNPIQNLTEEQRTERARHSAKTAFENGTHNFQNLSPEKKEQRAKNSSKSLKVKWVFYNPTTDIYKVHASSWKYRFDLGYSERLCKLSDWDDYKSTHNLDVELNY